MTGMIAKAYRIADAIRATGVPVVIGPMSPNWRTKPSAMVARATPMPSASARRMKPGQWSAGQLKEIYAPVSGQREQAFSRTTR